MKELRNLAQEIHRGKCGRDVFRKYQKKALEIYPDYAALELTFSACVFQEGLQEEKAALADKESSIVQRIWKALRSLYDDSCSREELIRELEELRRQITGKMDRFTAYTDRLLCYEYVLNHMGLKYIPESELDQRLSAMGTEPFIREIMRYLLDAEDQNKEKIRIVVGQIPARMTKNKLFEKIEEAMTLYRGGDRNALDEFLYILRTSAMVYEPAGNPGDYPDFEKGLEKLAEADYAHMSEAEYRAMAELLEVEAKAVLEITDFYYSLQEIVNDIYALCILSSHTDRRSPLYRKCLAIWEMLPGDYQEEMLVELEGEIESRVEASSHLEAILFEMRPLVSKEPDMESFLKDMCAVANLLSDSLFIDLNRQNTEKVADAGYVEKKTKEFLKELSDRFATAPRQLRRAITGQILEKLPVFFESAQEVEEYIRINLLGCQDKAEKCIVMEMLLGLIEEEREWGML